MLFNSYEFLFGFLPAVFLGFCLIVGLTQKSQRRTLALIWLVLASLFFYGFHHLQFLWLLLLSIFVNYALGILLVATHPDRRRIRQALLTIGIIFNLGLLGYYKYADFFVANLNHIAGTEIVLGGIVLPLAISFFTFQKIHYLVDVYRGEIGEVNFLKYAIFVTFFPQLIAGPIVKYKETVPQFWSLGTFRIDSINLAVGSTIFFIGLFKKVILADSFAPIADTVFGTAEQGKVIWLVDAWIGTLAYTMQIYFDFSGYTDMAIGLARIFNIKLPINFDSPYQARTIAEFWRRWHITLYRFLRDYVYIPLGGNRLGPKRQAVNILVTMGLSGIWHGAGWTFVIWGLLHGGYLVAHQTWRRMAPRQGAVGRLQRLLAIPLMGQALTLLAVMAAWVFFRAADMDTAGRVLAGMVAIGPLRPHLAPGGVPLYSWADYLLNFGLLTAGLVVTLLLPNTQQWMRRFDPILGDVEARRLGTFWRGWSWQPTLVWVSAVAVIAVLGLGGLAGEVREYIYYRF